MPTPAPDRATLYSVKSAVESAVRSRLTAAQAAPSIAIQRETANLPDSRIDVRFELGGQLGNRSYAWTGTLIVAIWTDRSVDDPATHGTREGIILDALQPVTCGDPYHADFGEDILPYHVFNRLALTTINPQCSITDDLDLSEARFDCVISVRPGCFPVEAFTYLRPGGTDHYFRPDGTSRYLRPAA
jgi:hypothetical protein